LSCSACEDRTHCEDRFECFSCGRTLNACKERVGGTESHLAPECTSCHEKRVFGPWWVMGWRKEKHPRLELQDELIESAQRYQERVG